MSLLRRIGSRQTGDSGEGSQNALSEAGAPYDPFNGHVATYNQVCARLDPAFDSHARQARKTVEALFNTILQEDNVALSAPEQNALFEAIAAEIIGFGPLEALLNDETVTEIMVNGPNHVYIVRKGRLILSNIRFENDAHVVKILTRMLESVGQPLELKSRIVDVRLPDRTHLNAVLAPIAQSGTTLTLRKFSKRLFRTDELIRFRSMTEAIATFLRACVVARLNIIVSGGGGSGKTTVLNALASFVPTEERIITIETIAELELRQDHVIALALYPLGFQSDGQLTLSDLVRNVQHMHADRVVIDEIRAGEALDIVQAMSWGYDGSLMTINANSPHDALARLEAMCLRSSINLPVRVLREQFASALHLIVQVERLRDGTRKIVKVTEIQGMEGDNITLSDIFAFEPSGFEAGSIGHTRPTGLRPKCLDQLEAAGQQLPPAIFDITDQLS